MKSKVAIIVLVCLLIGTLSFVLNYKNPIQNATYDELIEINGIGEVLSERIVSYLEANPDADLEELDHLKGIGEYRIKLLRRYYR